MSGMKNSQLQREAVHFVLGTKLGMPGKETAGDICEILIELVTPGVITPEVVTIDALSDVCVSDSELCICILVLLIIVEVVVLLLLILMPLFALELIVLLLVLLPLFGIIFDTCGSNCCDNSRSSHDIRDDDDVSGGGSAGWGKWCASPCE